MRDFDEPKEGEPLYSLWQEGWRPMDHAPLNEKVEAHIARCFGETATVLHEFLSLHVHLDVNVIPPSRGRRFTTYVTSGMSDLPMRLPATIDVRRWSRAELVIALPGPPESHPNHYLISEMQRLARFPHVAGDWLGFGHTLQGEEGGRLADDTELSAYLFATPIASPLTNSRDAFELKLGDGEFVHFYALVPIYQEELTLKLSDGNSDRLFQLLDGMHVTELYDPARPNSATTAPAKPKGLLSRLLGR
jgi:hypothetical protein